MITTSFKRPINSMNGARPARKCALYENIRDNLIVIYFTALVTMIQSTTTSHCFNAFECEKKCNRKKLNFGGNILPVRPVGT